MIHKFLFLRKIIIVFAHKDEKAVLSYEEFSVELSIIIRINVLAYASCVRILFNISFVDKTDVSREFGFFIKLQKLRSLADKDKVFL